MIEDLNSTNGILVQSKRVRHHNLNDGDVVTIGQHDLMYVDERRTRQLAPGRRRDVFTAAASHPLRLRRRARQVAVARDGDPRAASAGSSEADGLRLCC